MTEYLPPSLSTLSIELVGEHVAVVTLSRPQVANALDTRMGQELLAVFSAFSAATPGPRAVVLTGAGDRHFCAGGDLKERDGMSNADYFRQHAIFERMLLSILDCPVPVIAAVNGVAYAGGCEIALACDFIYAAEHARFALTETSLGAQAVPRICRGRSAAGARRS